MRPAAGRPYWSRISPLIEITVDAYRGEIFKGKVQAFDARLNQDSRTLMVRGTLPNPERKLLPGMFANAAVLAGELKAERRFVRVGPSQGDRIAIAEGIKAGEEVVTSGQLKLQQGSEIKVDNSGALKPPAELPKQ